MAYSLILGMLYLPSPADPPSRVCKVVVVVVRFGECLGHSDLCMRGVPLGIPKQHVNSSCIVAALKPHFMYVGRYSSEEVSFLESPEGPQTCACLASPSIPLNKPYKRNP